jgi:hypothetical protein
LARGSISRVVWSTSRSTSSIRRQAQETAPRASADRARPAGERVSLPAAAAVSPPASRDARVAVVARARARAAT